MSRSLLQTPDRAYGGTRRLKRNDLIARSVEVLNPKPTKLRPSTSAATIGVNTTKSLKRDPSDMRVRSTMRRNFKMGTEASAYGLQTVDSKESLSPARKTLASCLSKVTIQENDNVHIKINTLNERTQRQFRSQRALIRKDVKQQIHTIGKDINIMAQQLNRLVTSGVSHFIEL